MDHRAEWEKGVPPQTGVDAQRQRVFEQILRELAKARTVEDLFLAFELQSDWLCRHPDDLAMKRFGARMVREVERHGWAWEEFFALLRTHRSQTAAVASLPARA